MPRWLSWARRGSRLVALKELVCCMRGCRSAISLFQVFAWAWLTIEKTFGVCTCWAMSTSLHNLKACKRTVREINDQWNNEAGGGRETIRRAELYYLFLRLVISLPFSQLSRNLHFSQLACLQMSHWKATVCLLSSFRFVPKVVSLPSHLTKWGGEGATIFSWWCRGWLVLLCDKMTAALKLQRPSPSGKY